MFLSLNMNLLIYMQPYSIVFFKSFVGGFSGVVALIVNVVVSIFWVPVWITELLFLTKIFLWSPDLSGAMWVLLSWELSSIFRAEHLILGHHVMNSGIHFVLEEGIWNTEIIIWMNSDWQLTGNWIPRVFVHLPDWGVSEDHGSHFIISSSGPKDLNFLSLRVGDDLSGEVGLVTFIEDINTVVDDQVSIIDFFIWGQTQLLNSQCLLSSETWCSSHELLNISRLRSVIPWAFHLTINLLDIFHGVRTVIWRNWTTLSYWMNVSHIV